MDTRRILAKEEREILDAGTMREHPACHCEFRGCH